MIEINNIQKSFGRQQVLNKISLSLPDSCIIAVLGPNGSGKTTLIKTLLGLVNPDSGNISIGGKNIIGQDTYRKEICYLPQIARFPDYLTITEFFSFMESLQGPPQRKDELIIRFMIEKEMKKSLRKLSGGTIQKVNLINCLMYDRPLVILDEPTVGLDPVSLISLKTLLRNDADRGKLILISTHIMDFAGSLANEIIFLLEGNIYFHGSVNKLFLQTESKTMEQAVANLLENKTN